MQKRDKSLWKSYPVIPQPPLLPSPLPFSCTNLLAVAWSLIRHLLRNPSYSLTNWLPNGIQTGDRKPTGIHKNSYGYPISEGSHSELDDRLKPIRYLLEC
jgi:hypothetical protein